VSVAALRRLVAQGRIDGEGPVVACITGQGLKTADALAGRLPAPALIEPRLAAFEGLLAGALRGLV